MLKPYTTDPLGPLVAVLEVDCKSDFFWEEQELIHEYLPEECQVHTFFHGKCDEDCHLTIALPLEYADIADEIGFRLSKIIANKEAPAWLK